MKKIGLLGGGQLACLIAQSILKKNLKVCVFAQNREEPAVCYAHYLTIAARNDKNELVNFFKFCDVIILESEFFSYELLEELESETGTKVFPELSAYKKLATKEKQKRFFKGAEVSIPHTKIITHESDCLNLSYPLMLKKSYGSYDGLGNLIVKNEKEFKDNIIEFSHNFQNIVLAESFIDIDFEFACMLIKGKENSFYLPPVLTHQEQSVCHRVSFPLKTTEELRMTINEMMMKIDKSIEGCGVFAFEFFVDKKGCVFVNEAAPRVHNSYHFSIEAFNESQFDFMVKIALGEDIIPPQIKYPYVSMINILGKKNSADYHLAIPEFKETVDMKIYMYGKKESRIGRKLGHITVFGNETIDKVAQVISKEYLL